MLILVLFLGALLPFNEATSQNENFNSTLSTSNKTTAMNTEIRSEKKTEIILDSEGIAKLKALCPTLQNRTDPEIMMYRYFKNACFKLRYQGICGKGMQLFIKEDGSIYGECDCRPLTRLWIYHEDTSACYKIFSQGACATGHYHDLTQEGHPICAENPCASNGTDFYKLRGVCTQIGKPNPEVCKENEIVDFIPNRRTPTCVPSVSRVVTAIGIPPCKPGSLLAVHGKCHVAEWEFGNED